MNRTVRSAAFVVAPLTFALAGCGGSSGGSAPQASAPPSASLTASAPACTLPTAKASTNPPAAFPAKAVTWYEEDAVGKTRLHFGYVTGHNVVTERDALKRQLARAGFTLKDQDQEDNSEAEGEFKSAQHALTIQVIHLCGGKLRVRFRITK